MQRITRIAFEQSNLNKMQLLEQYGSLLSILKPHLTARTYSIFATPKLIDDNQYIGWYTNLEGQPTLLNDIIDESQKTEIKQTLATRINDIETAVKLISLTNEQKTLVSSWLLRIKNLKNNIYVINNEPVIVDTFEPVELPPVIAPVIVPKPFWKWWYTLILALLLLAALGLVWYFFNPFKESKNVEPITVKEEKKVEPTVEPPKEPVIKPQPEPEVKQEPNVPEPQPVVITPEPKPVPDPITKPEPKPEVKQEPKVPEPQPVVTPEPKPAPDPIIKPEPKPEPKPKVKNPPNCITKEELAKNSNPSKMALIFDNSLSMTVTLAESPMEVGQYFNYLSYGYPRGMSQQDRIDYDKRMTRLPTRLSTSKKMALTSIDKIQQNINISLVALNGCPVADTTPFYNYSSRGALKSKINRLTPSAAGGGGTPLYSGLEKASQMLDGVKRDDYILIISDGEDNCTRANICTLANHIASQKPRLKINIVDIAGEHKIDCIANATGGKVYIAQSPKDMIRQMNKAVSDLKINRSVCQ